MVPKALVGASPSVGAGQLWTEVWMYYRIFHGHGLGFRGGG